MEHQVTPRVLLSTTAPALASAMVVPPIGTSAEIVRTDRSGLPTTKRSDLASARRLGTPQGGHLLRASLPLLATFRFDEGIYAHNQMSFSARTGHTHRRSRPSNISARLNLAGYGHDPGPARQAPRGMKRVGRTPADSCLQGQPEGRSWPRLGPALRIRCFFHAPHPSVRSPGEAPATHCSSGSASGTASTRLTDLVMGTGHSKARGTINPEPGAEGGRRAYAPRAHSLFNSLLVAVAWASGY